VNRVVPAGEVRQEADELAATLAAKSTLTLTVTKEAVAAAARGDDPGPGTDDLVAGLQDPESREVGRAYLARVRRS
jgi:enoyl-CoA hydratase/carnithine racemase